MKRLKLVWDIYPHVEHGFAHRTLDARLARIGATHVSNSEDHFQQHDRVASPIQTVDLQRNLERPHASSCEIPAIPFGLPEANLIYFRRLVASTTVIAP